MKLKVDYSKTDFTNGAFVALEIKKLTGKLLFLEDCIFGEAYITGFLKNCKPEDIAILEKNNLSCEILPE